MPFISSSIGGSIIRVLLKIFSYNGLDKTTITFPTQIWSMVAALLADHTKCITQQGATVSTGEVEVSLLPSKASVTSIATTYRPRR